MDRLTVHQFDADRPLLLAQTLKESGFLKGLFRRRSAAVLVSAGISLRAERHIGIVHKGPCPLARLPKPKVYTFPTVIELTREERNAKAVKADSRRPITLGIQGHARA